MLNAKIINVAIYVCLLFNISCSQRHDNGESFRQSDYGRMLNAIKENITRCSERLIQIDKMAGKNALDEIEAVTGKIITISLCFQKMTLIHREIKNIGGLTQENQEIMEAEFWSAFDNLQAQFNEFHNQYNKLKHRLIIDFDKQKGAAVELNAANSQQHSPDLSVTRAPTPTTPAPAPSPKAP